MFAGCADSILFGGKTKDHVVEGTRVTSMQLRLRVQSLVNPMTGIVADAADKVIDESDDPEVRRAALRWKVAAVPAVRESLFERYPIVALLDTWALSYQMMDYFETGPGKAAFKDYAYVGYDAAKKINERMKFLYDDINVDDPMNDAATMLKKWAAHHPVKGQFDSRENITNRATEMTLQLGLSLGGAVDAMVTSVEDLSRKLDVYSDQLPSQARWEAQLFVHEASDEYEIEETFASMAPFMEVSTETLTQAKASMQEMPSVIAKEREAALEEFRATTDKALATFSQERKAIMAQFTDERKAVMGELHQARALVMEDIHREMDRFVTALGDERAHLVKDVEIMRSRLIEDAFHRLLILLGLIALYLTLLTIGILWFLDRRLWRPKRPA